MAFIYKITNQINGKIYIGKTHLTIEDRWKEHVRDSKRERNKDKPLYRAFNKYGIENFIIEQVEETEPQLANEREIYWIEQYNTFLGEGYNATRGGEGSLLFDYDEVVKLYREKKMIKAVSEELGISRDTVSKILVEFNQEALFKQPGKQVLLYNEEKIVFFRTLSDAARYIMKERDIKGNNFHGLTSHIADVCKGKRKSVYGYKCKFFLIKGEE